MKRAMFIGRWQPVHNGHKWLISQKLEKGIPVLIAVRDIPPDEKNPFTTEQTIKMLEKVYEDADVKIVSIPDIESVNYGRGVGYEINEFVPPPDIGFISATSIREGIASGNSKWKDSVDYRIHDMVVDFLNSSNGVESNIRPWGRYEVLIDEKKYKVKRIIVKPGQRPSYQYHFKRSETWVIVAGEGKVTINDNVKTICSGDIIEVPVECKHRIENTNDSDDLVFIEIQRGSYFGEDDIVRVEDDYDR